VVAPSGRTQAYTVEITRQSQVGTPTTLTSPLPNGADGFGSGVSVAGDVLFVDRDTELKPPGGPEAFLFQLDQGSWVSSASVEDVIGTAFRVTGSPSSACSRATTGSAT
jgi:hypothetical protein